MTATFEPVISTVVEPEIEGLKSDVAITATVAETGATDGAV